MDSNGLVKSKGHLKFFNCVWTVLEYYHIGNDVYSAYASNGIDDNGYRYDGVVICSLEMYNEVYNR